MFPPSYSVQLCLPSTGKGASVPKGGSVPKRRDAAVARNIASLQLNLLPLLAGINSVWKGQGGRSVLGVLHVSETLVLLGLPGGNCLERSRTWDSLGMKAGCLRKIGDLVLFWGRLVHVQRSVCSAGQDVKNNCIVVLHQHVRLNSLIQIVLKVGISVSVEWVVSVVFWL